MLESFRNGISHIELRMFDLNPLEPLGINADDLRFAHLLIMYLSELPDFEYTEELQIQAVREHQNAALFELNDVEIDGVPILQKAEQILSSMSERFAGHDEALRVIGYQKNKLTDRLCSKVLSDTVYGQRGR